MCTYKTYKNHCFLAFFVQTEDRLSPARPGRPGGGGSLGVGGPGLGAGRPVGGTGGRPRGVGSAAPGWGLRAGVYRVRRPLCTYKNGISVKTYKNHKKHYKTDGCKNL